MRSLFVFLVIYLSRMDVLLVDSIIITDTFVCDRNVMKPKNAIWPVNEMVRCCYLNYFVSSNMKGCICFVNCWSGSILFQCIMIFNKKFATLWSGRYTLSTPRGRYNSDSTIIPTRSFSGQMSVVIFWQHNNLYPPTLICTHALIVYWLFGGYDIWPTFYLHLAKYKVSWRDMP